MPTVFLPGIGRHDADAWHFQIDRQVVGQARDLVETQARLQGNLILRDDRAGIDLDHAGTLRPKSTKVLSNRLARWRRKLS